MSYQESFVTVKNDNDFYDFISRIRELGKEYYDYYNVEPRYIVTVKKHIFGAKLPDNDMSGIAKLHRGKSYVYFTGEKFLLTTAYRLVNAADYSDFLWNEGNKFFKQQNDYLSWDLIFVPAEEVEIKQDVIGDGLNNDYLRIDKFLWSMKEVREKTSDILLQLVGYPLNASHEQWESREFCLTAIALTKGAFRCVPRHFWCEADFCLEAVRRNAESFEWVKDDVKTEEMCYIAIKNDPHALDNVPKRLLSEQLILEAIGYHSIAFAYVPKMQLTKKIVVAAVKQGINIKLYVPDEWKEEAKEAMSINDCDK